MTPFLISTLHALFIEIISFYDLETFKIHFIRGFYRGFWGVRNCPKNTCSRYGFRGDFFFYSHMPNEHLCQFSACYHFCPGYQGFNHSTTGLDILSWTLPEIFSPTSRHLKSSRKTDSNRKPIISNTETNGK